MADEENKKKSVVKTTSIVAAGCASVVAALFTSKLGVAGTLVGTAMTSMVITLTSAILNAQFEKATSKVSGLPSSVRGRLSTQQVRMPGRPTAEPNPEPPPEETRPEPRRGEPAADTGSAGLLARLRSVPGRLRAMSSSTRRRVLVSGALAGVVATAIGLTIITSIETVANQPLSSITAGQNEYATGDGGVGTSVGNLLNRSQNPSVQQQQQQQQQSPSGVRNPFSGNGGQQYQQPGGGGGGGAGQQQQVPVEEPVQEQPAQQPAQQQPAAPSEQPAEQ